MSSPEKLVCAFQAFDAYNSRDLHTEELDGQKFPKELLYSIRMTEKLAEYAPDAPEYVRIAARCQHIGRWEIPRNTFPMDRKGYLQWRSKLAIHHCDIASRILEDCGFDAATVERVRFLLQKKELRQHHPDTQLLEDVICLVFIEHYLDDFALQHEDDKVVEILKKTIPKMSSRALDQVSAISMTDKVKKLLQEALA